MLRSFTLLLGVAAAAVAAAGAQAGSLCCGGCGEPCPRIAVEAVGPPAVAPFYVVDQGPVFYGPGITRGPSYFEVLTSPHRFPYIGNSYYWPYDGGPYADPVRHQVLYGPGAAARWQPPVVYGISANPRVITVSRDYAVPASRRGLRQPRVR
jgi:hypothetical protein